MIHYSEKNRSELCRMITNFHSAHQRRVARFDLWGMMVSAVMVTLIVGLARVLVSH